MTVTNKSPDLVSSCEGSPQLLDSFGILDPADTRSFFYREELNVGTVPTFKMHIIGTVPMFKMHNVGTVPTYKMYNIGTVPTFKMHNVGTLVFLCFFFVKLHSNLQI